MQKKRNQSTTRPSQRRATPSVAGPVKLHLRYASSENFRRKCERESLSLANDPHEVEVLEWIAKVSDSAAG